MTRPSSGLPRPHDLDSTNALDSTYDLDGTHNLISTNALDTTRVDHIMVPDTTRVDYIMVLVTVQFKSELNIIRLGPSPHHLGLPILLSQPRP